MSAITCEPISGPYGEKLDNIFGIKNCFYEYNPGNFVFPKQYNDIVQDVLDFKVREDDVWMISYPRTGSTWCQEMVWLIGNDLNFEEANKNLQQLRAPVLEYSAILITEEYNQFMKGFGNSAQFITNLPSPRFIKSHLVTSLLPTELEKVKPKIVYIARNPKDVCVSYYHYLKFIHNLHCTFEEFADLFLHGKVPVGSIWSHYKTYWNKRHDRNFLFLKYEDMKRDPKAAIRQTAVFLEKPLSEEQIDILSDHLEFSKMKSNRSVNAEPILENMVGKNNLDDQEKCFIRKGLVGDWKNYMSADLSRKFDECIEEITKDIGLTF